MASPVRLKVASSIARTLDYVRPDPIIFMIAVGHLKVFCSAVLAMQNISTISKPGRKFVDVNQSAQPGNV